MNEKFGKEILLSWERCKRAGLKREEGFCQPHPLYNSDVIKAYKRLLEIASPFLNTLFYAINEYRFLFALTDEKGILLDYRCNPQSEQGLVDMGFHVGISMAEEDVGTNGVGTAIAIDNPMIVYGEEHYCFAHQSWVTFGVPIHNENGDIIGGIACTEYKDLSHPHTLGMLIASGKAIEEQIKLERALQDNDIYSKFLIKIINSISDGLIYFGIDGQIKEINNLALKMLGNSDTSNLNISNIFSRDILDFVSNGKDSILDEEMSLKTSRGNKQCFVTVTSVKDNQSQLVGVVVILKEPSTIHSIANKIAGAQARFTFEDIIGDSPRIVETLNLARKAAESTSNVLIQGESGTGKELIAQAIHNDSSRSSKPFIAINCSAIPQELLESELFGYEAGTFTGALRGGKPGKFELANGGTILLDEIGDMPLNMQASLLRVVQEKSVTRLGSSKCIPVDIRIIASTNKKISDMVKKGSFRKDLFYRLNVINISSPPLREREDDIPMLVNYFIPKINGKLYKNIDGINKECMEALKGYSWPGNVRELENVIEYSINICENNKKIDLHCLPEEFKTINVEKIIDETACFEHITLDELEKQYIEKVLMNLNGNKTLASKVLGIDRGTLYNKIKKYNILL